MSFIPGIPAGLLDDDDDRRTTNFFDYANLELVKKQKGIIAKLLLGDPPDHNVPLRPRERAEPVSEESRMFCKQFNERIKDAENKARSSESPEERFGIRRALRPLGETD